MWPRKIQLNSSDLSVVEGDDLKLRVEYEDPGSLSWKGPAEVSASGSEFVLDNILTSQQGIYSALLINSQNCKSEIEYNVSVEYLALDVNQAEDFRSQSGVQTEGCSDVGGGQNVGFIENNDWCTYDINIEEAGIYDFTARVATAASGGRIELSTDGKILATVSVSGASSDGWQDWYTALPIEAEFTQGKHELKLTYKGGGGYLFNIN